MSNKITKQFRSVFILDASKLSRLLNIIEGRFADLGRAPIYTFRFLTKNEKTYLRNSVDEVLRHDNPVNNPIVELAIVCKDKEKEPENLCCVEYNKDHSYIDVDVTSLDAKKGAELFAEIEEQIERCMDKSLAYRVKLGGLFFILPLLMVFMMGVVIYSGLFGEGKRDQDLLSISDISYLAGISERVDSDKEMIEFMYEYQKRKMNNIISERRTVSERVGILFNYKVALLLLPFVVVIGGISYIVGATYIGSIFLWGDFIEHNRRVTERRKLVWNAVVVALLIGIVGNLFVLAFSQYISPA